MSTDAVEQMWVYGVWAWLVANRKRVLTVLAVLAVAGSVMGVMNHQQKLREISAGDSLLKLQMKREGKAKAADYASVVEQFPGTAAAERAAIMAATTLFEEGRFADARTGFNDYLASQPDGLFRSTAMLGVAACEDAANEVDKAMASYEQVISTFPNEGVAAQAKLALALILESKDLSRAYKLYDEVAKLPGSAFAGQGRMKAQQLTEEHPELKPAAPAPLPLGVAAPGK